MYAVLDMFTHTKTRQCNPKLPALMEAAGMTRSTVSSAIQDLEKAGLLAVERTNKGNNYRLARFQHTGTGVQHTGTGVQHTGTGVQHTGTAHIRIDKTNDKTNDKSTSPPTPPSDYRALVDSKFTDAQRAEARQLLTAWTERLPHKIEPQRDLVALMTLRFEQDVTAEELLALRDFLADTDNSRFWSTPAALLKNTSDGTPVLGELRHRQAHAQQKEERRVAARVRRPRVDY